jgi:hypothetical protein
MNSRYHPPVPTPLADPAGLTEQVECCVYPLLPNTSSYRTWSR